MKRSSAIIFALFIVLECGLSEASAQFYIKIPKSGGLHS